MILEHLTQQLPNYRIVYHLEQRLICLWAEGLTNSLNWGTGGVIHFIKHATRNVLPKNCTKRGSMFVFYWQDQF